MTTTPSDDEGLREEIWAVFEGREKTDVDHMLINIMDKLVPYVSQKIREANQRVQRCPVCNGTGKRDSYIDSPDCRCCKGAMILTKERISTLTTKQDTKEKS